MWVRGWNLFGRSRSMSTSRERSAAADGTGASGMSALRPRPSAGRLSAMLLLLGVGRFGGAAGEHFARERQIGLGAAGFHVVDDARDAVARRLAEPDIARNHGGVDPLLEERPDI